MLAAGELRHTITIQGKTLSPVNEYGEQAPVWSDFATGIRCKKVQMSGKEIIIAGAEKSSLQTRFFIRAIPGIDDSMRVIDSDGGVNEIISIIDSGGLGRELEILTKAWVDEA